MAVKCNKFETEEPARRLYAFPEGKADFKKAADVFNARGAAVARQELREV